MTFKRELILKKMEKPAFVYRDRMISDSEYIAWIELVKQRFQRAQSKAIIRVNTAMLEFYWSIGRDLVALKAEQKWGAGVVKQFAQDMRHAFPYSSGFSWSNVKDMKRWYLFYNERIAKSQQPVGFFKSTSDEKSQQAVGPIKRASTNNELMEMPELFGKIPWGHHIRIISKSNTLEEAIFYINSTIEGNWSRSMLESQMENNLYGNQGNAQTNFCETLPVPQGKLAQEILKDPYNFEFLSMKSGYDEKELEDALMANITRFLLELGKGFAFVGRQIIGVATYQLKEVVERTVAEIKNKK